LLDRDRRVTSVFEGSREYLRSLALPADDAPLLPTSAHRFGDGGWYRWEVAGWIDAEVAAQLFRACEGYGVFLNQLTHTAGIMRLLDREIGELVAVCEEAGRQLVLAVGPRSAYDISAQRLASSPAAQASAYRLRGVEQVVRAIADVERAVELGARGFLVFDEGLLWVLHRMRTDGKLPASLRFKASSGLGVSNPFHCRAVADLGADSINLQRDLELGMIAAARLAVRIPFDLHTDNPPSTGGFVRMYEAPEMIRVAAPVYLKAGGSVTGVDDERITSDQVALVARELAAQQETITRLAPELVQSVTRDP
jgi:hypothetical protein